MTKRFIVPFLFLLSLTIFPTIIFAAAPRDTVYTIRTVVLDAGHGGAKPGTRGARSVEKDVVLQVTRSEEHTSELQSRENLVCRLLLEKTNRKWTQINTKT